MRDFHLTRYFVLTSFVTTIAVMALTSIISSRHIREGMIDEARDHAVRVIRHLQHDLDSYFIQPTLERDEVIDLSDPAQLEVLDRVVRGVAENFFIENIYIFDTDGNILYSTELAHIGLRTPDSNELYWSSIRGEVCSEVRNRGAPLDLSTDGAPTSLLETYVPVPSLALAADGARSITNVIETYQDLERFQRKVRRSQRANTAYMLAGSLILFGALFLIVRRADRVIRERAGQLRQSNQLLRDLSAHLEEEVEKRTQELVENEKLASIGVLAAGLAHEINNPLATIATCSQGLQGQMKAYRENGDLDVDHFDDYLDLIFQESFRVKSITTNLLDFSRKQMSRQIDEINLHDYLEEIVTTFQEHKPRNGTRVSLDSRSVTTATLHANPTTIRQVLLNITQNALDAVDEKRRGTPGAGPGEVVWRLEVGPEGTRITCRDNGIGFTPEQRIKLFEPFYTTKPPGQGTGLGLSLCHSFVKRYGGRIVAHSAGPGMGSRFVVEFPPESADPA